jgi:hypothetical protein
MGAVVIIGAYPTTRSMSYLADSQALAPLTEVGSPGTRLQMICTSDLSIVGLGAEKYVLQPTE